MEMGSILIHQRKISLCEEIQRRGKGIVRATFKGQIRLALGQQQGR
jgi:hypothetical protein